MERISLAQNALWNAVHLPIHWIFTFQSFFFDAFWPRISSYVNVKCQLIAKNIFRIKWTNLLSTTIFAALYTSWGIISKNTGEKEHLYWFFFPRTLFNNLISSIHDTFQFSISSFISWKKTPFIICSYSLAIIVHIKRLISHTSKITKSK